MAVYDFKYSNNNSYGHVVELLRRNVSSHGIHLDIGCGYGHIAKEIEKLGLNYIGMDADPISISNMKTRNITAYVHTFGNIEEDKKYLLQIIDDKKISSISVIDMLEHINFGKEFLQMLHEIAKEHQSLLILSIPNIAHNDIIMKLLTGDFDYTETGLLDNTHIRFYTEKSLLEFTNNLGWKQIDAYDIYMEKSDQYFPNDHPLLSNNANLSNYIRKIIKMGNTSSNVNQFIRAYLPFTIPQKNRVLEKKPFLSVITRTQGKRLNELREMLLCLCGQDCQDFEVIVISHKADIEKQISIENIINELPEYLKEKTRLIKIDYGTCATLLNIGFELAKGEYVSALDDDDMVFSNWVQTFKNLSKKRFGSVLRANVVSQIWEIIQTQFNEYPTVGACGALSKIYSVEFNLIEHFFRNSSPFMSLAFPSSIFHSFNIRFDEKLTTTEDWDFLLRMALICGVENSSEVTSIFRRLLNVPNSLTMHDKHEWHQNYIAIQNKLDQEYLLLPPGSIGKLIRFRENMKTKP